MKNKIKIAPSILSADFAKLGEEIQAIEKAGADLVHVDVMDGAFVPNLTIGPVVIKSLRKVTKLPFDVHLMIENPEKYIEDYRNAGADIITIHAEASTHLDRAIAQIKATGAKAGVSIVPSTPVDVLKHVLPRLDLVLVMSVNPGFGGQKFIEYSLDKISELRKMIDAVGKEIMLEVDGGINNETVKRVIAAGADTLVAGSAVFDGNPANYANNIKNLRV
ncbi:MAG TPA: ribulose-phosphate 3-epimerase [Alphaproteobacteria bacterium]|nr:ribulose-phosphate 3-epimerase [Alphaproteobacteria bacterium]